MKENIKMIMIAVMVALITITSSFANNVSIIKDHEVEFGKVHSWATLCSSIKDDNTKDYFICIATYQIQDDGSSTTPILIYLKGDIKTVFDVYNNKYENETAIHIANLIEEMFINANDEFMYNSELNRYIAHLYLDNYFHESDSTDSTNEGTNEN